MPLVGSRQRLQIRFHNGSRNMHLQGVSADGDLQLSLGFGSPQPPPYSSALTQAVDPKLEALCGACDANDEGMQWTTEVCTCGRAHGWLPAAEDGVLVAAFHPHHAEHGYSDDFFGVRIGSASQFVPGRTFHISGVAFTVSRVTNEMEHEGAATGICYVYTPLGDELGFTHESKLKRVVRVGDDVSF